MNEILTFILFLFCVTFGYSQNNNELDKGFIAIDESDIYIAKNSISFDSLKLLIEKGEQGDTSIQLFLAKAYYNGDRLKEDNEKAFYWFYKAAKLENAVSMFYLGTIYDNGYGVIQDYIKAKYWYEISANLGNTDAMNNIGALYGKGNGVNKDYIKAKYWYEKAANLGNADAMYKLGLLYYKREECINAIKWLEKAASFGLIDAYIVLGDIYNDPLEHVVVKEECENIKDNKKSIFYYEKSISHNNIEALYKMGFTYYWLFDYEKCIYYYNKAIEQNNTNAMIALANMYVYGVGVEKNYYKAKELYDKAKELGRDEKSIHYASLESINPNTINGVSLGLRKIWVEHMSPIDFQNGWIYLTETNSSVTFFKEVSKDGYDLKVWVKSIPKNNQLTNFRLENAKLFNSATTKQKINTQLNSLKSLYIINCNNTKIGVKSSIYYSKDGSVIYNNNDELFNSYDMSEVIPESIGEDILKTVCEYYEKYGK